MSTITTKSPVTLRMVAQAAKTSLSTASYALRNHPRIRAETCSKVHEVARRLGYVRDPILAALMSRNRRQQNPSGEVIAYVSGSPSKEQWRSSFPQRELFSGACDQAKALGCRVELFLPIAEGWTDSRLEQILRARGIRGLVVAPFPTGPVHLELDWGSFATVAIGYSLVHPHVHRVAVDHFHNMGLALAHGREAGYQRIGCVLPQPMAPCVDQFRAAGLALGGPRQREQRLLPWLCLAGDDSDACRFRAWFRRHCPDFIVTRGEQVSHWLAEMPGRASTAWVDLGLHPASGCAGGVDEHSRRVGALAVDRVSGCLRTQEFGAPEQTQHVLLPGEWRWSRLRADAPCSQMIVQ